MFALPLCMKHGKFHIWFIDIPSQTLKFNVNQKEKKKLLILWQQGILSPHLFAKMLGNIFP